MITSNHLDSMSLTYGDDDSILFDELSCADTDTLSSLKQSSTGSSRSPLKLNRYFGAAARNEFGRRFRWLNIQRRSLYIREEEMANKTRFESSYDHQVDEQEDYDKDDNISVDSFDAPSVQEDVENGTLTSPRTRYITSCITKKLNPRMNLILRKRVSPELNLQHQGMGDEMGVMFAETLGDMPYVHAINLSDNNLSDVSIQPIIQAIISLANVTHLNMSNNNMDSASSRALAEYLGTSACPLRTLILQKSDIDDCECQLFVTALAANRTLTELDLSMNLIGQAETLNTVHPEIVTGGEALADLLASSTCPLKVTVCVLSVCACLYLVSHSSP